MKPWIETDKFVIDLDEDVTSSAKGGQHTDEIVSNVAAFGTQLATLIAQLNAAQWEIKAVLPVLKGIGRRETTVLEQPPPVKGAPPAPAHAGAAIGVGWGVSVVDQVVVIVQRTLWIDDAAYEARLGPVLREEARVRIGRERDEIMKANARAQVTIDKLSDDARAVETADIVFKEGGFLSKRGYRYAGTTYETAEEAEAQRARDLQAVQARILELQRTQKPLPEMP